METEELTVVVSQASALSNCLFAVVIDVITGEVRKEPLGMDVPDVSKFDYFGSTIQGNGMETSTGRL